MITIKRRRGWLPLLASAAALQIIFVSYRMPVFTSHVVETRIDQAEPGILDTPEDWSTMAHTRFAESIFQTAEETTPAQ